MKGAKRPEQKIERHRRSFSKFVQANPEREFGASVRRLHQLWEKWNDQFFGGELIAPYINFTEPRRVAALGCYRKGTSLGVKGAEIKIRPSLLSGLHPSVKPGKQFQRGRFLFVADVLLHEMIHQWQDEIIKERDRWQGGHGATFRNKCNQIGEVLGLKKVRTEKRRGKDQDLESCAQWPHNVRDSEYYRGAASGPRAMTPLGELCLAAREFGKNSTSENAMVVLAAAILYADAKKAEFTRK
jgi:SprT-like family